MTRPFDAFVRAIELASSGDFLTIDEIKQQLKVEGFKTHAIAGKIRVAQLRLFMTRAQLTAA